MDCCGWYQVTINRYTNDSVSAETIHLYSVNNKVLVSRNNSTVPGRRRFGTKQLLVFRVKFLPSNEIWRKRAAGILRDWTILAC